MKLSIFIAGSFLNIFFMDCGVIKSVSEIEKYLGRYERKLGDDDEQLQTNQAFVYKLPTGEIVIVPNLMQPNSKGLILASFECYQACLDNDKFPIENENKMLFEYDLEGQRRINHHIDKYQEHLNARLTVNYKVVDRSTVQSYYKGILKIKPVKEMDVLALGAIMGELQRREVNGRWVLEKLYGTFNPYYKPLIVHPKTNRIESPYDKLMSMIKWKEKDVNKFFDVLPMRPYPTLDASRQAGRVIIELR